MRRGDVERLGLNGVAPPSFFGGRFLRTFMVSVSGGAGVNFLTSGLAGAGDGDSPTKSNDELLAGTTGLAGDGDGATKSNDEILDGFENNGDSVGAFAGENNSSCKSLDTRLVSAGDKIRSNDWLRLRCSFLSFTSPFTNEDCLSFNS